MLYTNYKISEYYIILVENYLISIIYCLKKKKKRQNIYSPKIIRLYNLL